MWLGSVSFNGGRLVTGEAAGVFCGDRISGRLTEPGVKEVFWFAIGSSLTTRSFTGISSSLGVGCAAGPREAVACTIESIFPFLSPLLGFFSSLLVDSGVSEESGAGLGSMRSSTNPI